MILDSMAALPSGVPTSPEATSLLGSLLDNFGTPIAEGNLLSMAFRASKIWCSQALYNKAMRRALTEAQGRIRHYFSNDLAMASSTRSPTAAISDAVADLANEFFTHPTDQDWNEW